MISKWCYMRSPTITRKLTSISSPFHPSLSHSVLLHPAFCLLIQSRSSHTVSYSLTLTLRLTCLPINSLIYEDYACPIKQSIQSIVLSPIKIDSSVLPTQKMPNGDEPSRLRFLPREKPGGWGGVPQQHFHQPAPPPDIINVNIQRWNYATKNAGRFDRIRIIYKNRASWVS
jgi:hypothetical protein